MCEKSEEVNIQENFLDDERNILEPYGELLFNWVENVGPDIIEIGMDRFFSEGFWKEVPVVRTIMSTGALILHVNKYFRIKHVLVFAQQLNRNELSQKKIKKHLERLNKNPKKKFQELEIMIESITKHSKYIKDQILANFYLLYCDPDVDFSWKDFETYNEVVQKLFPYDLETLAKIYVDKQYVDFSYDRVAMLRLRNMGLVDYYDTAPNTVYTFSKDNFTARITPAGEFFWEEGLRDLVLYHAVDDEERIL